MKTWPRVRTYTLVSALIFASYSARVLAQTNSEEAQPEVQKPTVEPMGSTILTPLLVHGNIT